MSNEFKVGDMVVPNEELYFLMKYLPPSGYFKVLKVHPIGGGLMVRLYKDNIKYCIWWATSDRFRKYHSNPIGKPFKEVPKL